MLDLLVVGAGLSGLMAAYSAAKAGLKVKIVNKGLGLIHWNAGTVDVFGYDPQRAQEPIEFPLETISSRAQKAPDHPYSRLGETAVSSSLDEFLNLMRELAHPYAQAKGNKNFLFPSPAGAVRPTFYAPRGQLAGDLSRPEPLLIAGFQGLRDFYPLLIAENLAKQGYQARAIILAKDLLTDRSDANNVQLAEGLEKEPRRTRLGQALKNAVKPGERIGLPAILGMSKHAELLAELEEISGAPIFEIPTLPPSVPGIRLFQAIQGKLRSMGVRIESAMEVIEANTLLPANGSPGHINWLETETSARPLKHQAANYLLATGGILGGGFNSDLNGRVWEVILDLPLTTPQDRGEWFHSLFLSPDGHPVYSGGVMVNQSFQPVNGEGKVLYDNLWAAGQMLTGANPILERSIEGIAITTGLAAGKAVAQR